MKGFILTLFKLRLSGQMMYRFSYFAATFVDGSMFLLWVLMFEVIYGQVDVVGGWDKGRMMIFLGTFSLLNAINMTLYFFGLNGIPSKIRDGSLDNYITKPVNPLLRLSFENIDAGSFPLIIFSGFIIAYGAGITGITVTLLNLIIYLFYVAVMAVLYYDMEVIIRTLPFFTMSTQSTERLEAAALDLCMRIPGILYRGVFKILFYIILPYGIMSTVPTQILIGETTPVEAAGAFATVVLFTVIMLKFWKFGLRHYKSASS